MNKIIKFLIGCFLWLFCIGMAIILIVLSLWFYPYFFGEGSNARRLYDKKASESSLDAFNLNSGYVTNITRINIYYIKERLSVWPLVNFKTERPLWSITNRQEIKDLFWADRQLKDTLRIDVPRGILVFVMELSNERKPAYLSGCIRPPDIFHITPLVDYDVATVDASFIYAYLRQRYPEMFELMKRMPSPESHGVTH